MLKKTLSTNENININSYLNLKSIIKANAKGYKPKKAFVLRWNQIMEFMNTAPAAYLALKVILAFGICGCLRCDEIAKMKVEDVKDLGNNRYLVSINNNKNEYAGQFIIGSFFYGTVKEYISLRPADGFSDRFFIQYRDGRCVRQSIGRHKIGQMPEMIASYLKLPNPQRYTGHCFRRSSATLLSDSGANMQMIKQLGRWRSDRIAQGYIENSLHNRQLIYDGVVQHTKPNIYSAPSTSAQVNQ